MAFNYLYRIGTLWQVIFSCLCNWLNMLFQFLLAYNIHFLNANIFYFIYKYSIAVMFGPHGIPFSWSSFITIMINQPNFNVLHISSYSVIPIIWDIICIVCIVQKITNPIIQSSNWNGRCVIIDFLPIGKIVKFNRASLNWLLKIVVMRVVENWLNNYLPVLFLTPTTPIDSDWK